MEPVIITGNACIRYMGIYGGLAALYVAVYRLELLGLYFACHFENDCSNSRSEYLFDSVCICRGLLHLPCMLKANTNSACCSCCAGCRCSGLTLK